MARLRDTDLDIIILSTYVDTVYILQKQIVALIVGWESDANMMERWSVFLAILLGPPDKHSSVYEINLLIYEAEELNYWMKAQEQFQPDML